MKLHIVIYILAEITISSCSESNELDFLLELGVCEKENSTLPNQLIKVPAADFNDLIENSYIFVDKSLLAKSIFKSRTTFMLQTYPRKWGKTINLSMLKLFLQMNVHPNGTLIRPEDTRSYGFFKRGEIVSDGKMEKLKKPPLIAQYPDIIEQHLAKYPVLYVDLLTAVPSITDADLRFEDFFKAIQKTISGVFAEHVYLVEILKNKVANFRNGTKAYNETTALLIGFKKYLSQEEHDPEAMKRSLEFLASVAHKCFSQVSMILIDNYDALVNAIDFDFPNRIDFREIPKIATFCVEFIFRSLESNKFAYKGVITGTFPADIRYRYKIALRIKRYHTLAINLHPFHGLSRREVSSLFGHLGMNVSKEVHQWYGGYNIDDFPRVKIYNLWSVVNFINQKRIANYTQAVEKFRIFNQTFACKEIRSFFEAVISRGAQVAVHPPEFFVFNEDIGQIHRLVSGAKKYDDAKVQLHLIFMFFYTYGYLTLDYNEWVYAPVNALVQPVFPNEEMKSEILQHLLTYYTDTLGSAVSDLTRNTARLLVQFVESKDHTNFPDSDLQKNLHSLYYQHLSTKSSIQANSTIKLKSDKVHDWHFLTLLFAHLNFNYSIGMNSMYYEEKIKYQIPYIVLYNDHFGTFINFNYGSHFGTWLAKDTGQLWQNLNETKKYINFFAGKPTVKCVQFVEFFVPLDSRCISVVTESLQIR